MALFAPSPSTSTSTPAFAPGVLGLSSFLSNEVLRNFLLPSQRQSIQGWGALGRGAFGQAPGIEGPAESAGVQSMAQFGGLTSQLPGDIAAPLQEGVAAQARQLPRQLQTIAPNQLAQLVQALVDPQFADLLRPGTSTTNTQDGPSDVSSGLGIASLISTLAKLGTSAAGLFA